jgi:membrane fusion protein, multidrug efflux system
VVSGKVVRIAVIEGQQLNPGDELFAIDEEPYRLTAQEAKARLKRVESDFTALKASLASLARQIELSRQSLASAHADFDRKTRLLDGRISSPSDVDKARITMVAAKAQLELLEQQERTARIQLLGDPDLAMDRYPQFIEAIVALERARRDLANTVLRAPIAGVATQVSSIQMGRYLTAGTPVFSIISSDLVWIDANPKETDLTYVRPGQPVVVTVDAFPDRQWQGQVGAISPGTGAQFAILPPQNAAGNWIKVVQRVPMRIEFDPGQDLRRLRAGMSATVEIDTGRRSRLARLFGASAVAENPDR